MYITIDDLKKAVDEDVLIRWTDDDDTGVINTDILNDMIAAAEDEVNGYISKRYPVPLEMVPNIIKRLTKDIAVYNTASRKELLEEEGTLRTRYRDAVRMLRDIGSGKVDIGVGSEYEEMKVTAREKKYTEDYLDKF